MRSTGLLVGLSAPCELDMFERSARGILMKGKNGSVMVLMK